MASLGPQSPQFPGSPLPKRSEDSTTARLRAMGLVGPSAGAGTPATARAVAPAPKAPVQPSAYSDVSLGEPPVAANRVASGYAPFNANASETPPPPPGESPVAANRVASGYAPFNANASETPPPPPPPEDDLGQIFAELDGLDDDIPPPPPGEPPVDASVLEGDLASAQAATSAMAEIEAILREIGLEESEKPGGYSKLPKNLGAGAAAAPQYGISGGAQLVAGLIAAYKKDHDGADVAPKDIPAAYKMAYALKYKDGKDFETLIVAFGMIDALKVEAQAMRTLRAECVVEGTVLLKSTTEITAESLFDDQFPSLKSFYDQYGGRLPSEVQGKPEAKFVNADYVKAMQAFANPEYNIKLEAGNLYLIPPMTQPLPNIWRLTIEQNQLAALPDHLFENLPGLQILSCVNNQLTHLPSGMTKCPELSGLELHGNPLDSKNFTFLALPELVALKLPMSVVEHAGALTVQYTKLADLQFKQNRVAEGTSS